MNIDIREYIKNNFKENNEEEIIKIIDTASSKKDDEPLIGLGVFMEMLWDKSSRIEKENIANKIHQGL